MKRQGSHTDLAAREKSSAVGRQRVMEALARALDRWHTKDCIEIIRPMFRTPLQRVAMRLHIVGSTPAPLPESEMEIALYLNFAVAVVGAGALVVWGAHWGVALAMLVGVFVALSLALYHRWWRWVSIAFGTTLATGVGVAFGMLSDRAIHVAIGAAIGLAFAALGYGRLVAQSFR